MKIGVRFPSLAHTTGVCLAVPAFQSPCYFLCLSVITSDHSHTSAGHMDNRVGIWSRSLRDAKDLAVFKNVLDLLRVK